jgi:hypothetical protein
MKKLVLITIIAILAIFPFTNLSAQFAIPTYAQELNGTSITLEEEHPPGIMVSERRKMNVGTSRTGESVTTTVTFMIYKLDNTEMHGPYTVVDDIPFLFDIDEDEWGVKVLEYDPDAELSVWIE